MIPRILTIPMTLIGVTYGINMYIYIAHMCMYIIIYIYSWGSEMRFSARVRISGGYMCVYIYIHKLYNQHIWGWLGYESATQTLGLLEIWSNLVWWSPEIYGQTAEVEDRGISNASCRKFSTENRDGIWWDCEYIVGHTWESTRIRM